MTPHYGARKAIVIVDADRLHPSAANALLKTLEEPPPGRHFLLVTSRPQRLLPTVRSRCIRLQFKLPSTDDALAWLAGEGVGNEQATLTMAGGAPLRALELQTDAPVRTWLIERFLVPLDTDPIELSGEIDAEKLPAVVDTLQRWCQDLAQVRLGGRPLMHSDLEGPVNIGCPQYVTVDELAQTAIAVSGKQISIRHVDGPRGVQSRNFSNARIYALGWQPKVFLREGISYTYAWIEEQVQAKRGE